MMGATALNRIDHGGKCMEGTPEVVDTVIIAQKNAAGSTMSPDSVNCYTLNSGSCVVQENKYKKGVLSKYA